MNIDETLESMSIISDNKARRVLNTAPNKEAEISLEQIEQGITIETIEKLDVPAYQYSTQITIHGTFNNIPNNLRVHGYKSVFLNKNGSLGIRYMAIDGAKKELLRECSRYCNEWNVDKTSQGYEAYKLFADEEELLACYHSTPDNLYIGNKRAVKLMYGGYAVIIEIGAIYEQNTWPLIEALTGINNQSEYEQLKKAQTEQEEMRFHEYQQERDQARIQKEKMRQKLQKMIESKYNIVVNPISGICYKLSLNFNNEIQYMKCEFKMRGKTLMRRASSACQTFEEAQNQNLYQNFKKIARKEERNYQYIESEK